MSVLSRYIFREILLFFTVTLLAFTGILFTIRILKLASLVVNKFVPATKIIAVFLAIIPTFMEIAIPLAVLLGVMMAFARLSGDSELIVLRASGVSISRLVRPVIAFGLLSSLLALGVAHILKPWGFRSLSKTLFEIAQVRSSAGIEAGVFNELGTLTIYPEKIDESSGAMENVLVDDRRAEHERRIILARRGQLISNPAAHLITFALEEGTIHEESRAPSAAKSRYISTKFSKNSVSFDVTTMMSSAESSKGRSAREMEDSEIIASSREIRALLSSLPPDSTEATKSTSLSENSQSREATTTEPYQLSPLLKSQFTQAAPSPSELRQRLSRLDTELQLRFSMPLAAAILALIALPLGIHPPRTQRSWGGAITAAIAMAVFVIYYGVLSVGLALADSKVVSTWVGVWMPNFVAFGMAIFLLRKFWHERWSSVGDGVLGWIERVWTKRQPREVTT